MTRKIIGLLSLILVTTLFSCSSDSNDDTTPPTASSSISATIGGQAWSSMGGGAIANVQSVDIAGESKTVLQIVGTRTDLSVLTIQFPIDQLAVGTHTFVGDSEEGLLTYLPGGSTNIYASTEVGGSLTVTITSVDLATRKFSGTFSGTVIDSNGNSLSITSGVMNSLNFISSQLYSNGNMSLSRAGGTTFTMDGDNNDGKWLLIAQTTGDNSINLSGNNTNLGVDFGIYSVTFPTNVTTGTYNLTNSGFGANISNSNTQAEFHLVSGSLTITSHNGNNVTGTFSYTVNNGSETIAITNGSFNITHN